MERPDLKQARRRLLGPAEAEVGCDECFDVPGRYVELELVGAGAGAGAAIPGPGAHLAGCPACREKHESRRARRWRADPVARRVAGSKQPR